MSETVSRRRVTPRQSDHIVLLMLLMVVIPAAIALHTVRVPASPPRFQFQPHPARLYVEHVAVHCADRIDCRLVFTARRRGDPAEGFLADSGDSGPLRRQVGFFLRPLVLLFPEPGRNAWNRGPGLGLAGSYRRVCLLLDGLHHGAPYLYLGGRILVRGLQRCGLPGRVEKNPAPLAIPWSLRGAGARTDHGGHRLQEGVITDPGRLSRILDLPRSYCVGSGNGFLPFGSAVHQLAGIQPDTVHRRPDQPHLGGDVGPPLRLVGFSEKTDDRPLHRSVVWLAHRGGRRVGCSFVRHGDCFRDS